MQPAKFMPAGGGHAVTDADDSSIVLLRTIFSRLIAPLLFAALIFSLAWISLSFTRYDSHIASFWLANAVAAAVLLQVEMAERPTAIRLAVIARDQDAARREAHSLKGACRSIGAMALGQAAAVIEMAPDLQTMETGLAMLDRQTARTRQAIEELMPRNFPQRDAG